MERLSKSINLLNDVAMGRRKADLVLEGCSLVSVYTGEIVPDTQVAIANGRIAYVGSDASHTIGSKIEGKNQRRWASKSSIYKGKRRASAPAEDKKGYGGQKFPKLAKPAKVTKKVTRILTCPECKKKFNTYGIRIKL